MINILRMINKEKNLIEQELAKPEDERITFYKEFFKKYKADTLSGAMETPTYELAIAIIGQRLPSLPIDKLTKVISSTKAIFDKDDDNSDQLQTIVMNFSDDPALYRRIKKMLEAEDDYSLSSLMKKDGRLAIIVRHFLIESNIEPNDFFTLVELYIKHKQVFTETLAMLDVLKEIAKDQEFHNFMIQMIGSGNGLRIKNKDREKEVRRIIGNDYKIDLLLEPLTTASKACAQYELDRKDRHKTLERQKKIYETLENELYKAIQNGEVTNISSLLKKVPSSEIRLAILKLVYTHNQEIYKALSAEYQTLSANDASQYQILLERYGITPDSYEVGTVMENNIDDLTKMLEILSRLSIKTPSNLLTIIQNSDLETIENIFALAERGIITGNLVQNHISLFNPSSKEYESFMRNLDLITKKKLNPHYFTASEEMLTIPHQRFATSLKTLDDYQLLPNLKTGMNLSFMQEQGLHDAIDTLLELGFESNLEECLELLNFKDKFSRLSVLKTLNIPVTDTKELLEILQTDKFYVPDNEIPNYIYNATKYHLPKNVIEVEEPKKKVSDVTRLASFSNTERTYDIGGVLISKNRVHRNLSHVLATGKPTERIIYGVLKDATLSDEEVLKVVAAITPQKQTRVVKEKK